MTGVSLPFKATMELNKDIITQDELKQNQLSINEQSTTKQQVDVILIIPHSLFSSEQRCITWVASCKMNGMKHGCLTSTHTKQCTENLSTVRAG